MTTLTPTSEQQAILDAVATGANVAITAGAGTGKTSTLKMIANADPSKRWLYLAYNKAIQLDAEASFPKNVMCRTAHSLAHRQFGRPMQARLNGRKPNGRQTAEILGITKGIAFHSNPDLRVGPIQLAAKAIEMVVRYCRSADRNIGPQHFLAPEGVSETEGAELALRVLPHALTAWKDMIAPQGRLKPTHDVYFKQWALTNPKLDFWGILYDEAQDADLCVAGVVDSQKHCQIIAVGDSAQAIYGWRGAGDYLATMPATYRQALTQSWRFGPAVADEANVWLGVVGAELRVVGSPHLTSTVAPLDKPDAILCRTNAGTVERLMEAHTNRVKVHLVGEGTEMLKLARAAQRMMRGERPDHPELVAFRSWDQVVDYAENDPMGSDLALAVRLIEEYGCDEVVDAIAKAVPAEDASLVVSTAHKAKGLEWNAVQIGDDFKQPLEKDTGRPLPIAPDEAMLAYVAVTRAKLTLDAGGLAWIRGHLAALGK
jgi:hypothetical protein